jgi:glycerol-3-phosphate acyltransferase PlsY
VRGLALLALGYACGSIPAGLLLARLAGVDVRQAGSGNVGATNVARTAGLGLGLATLVFDACKGAFPVLVARGSTAGTDLQAAVGAAALLGHVFPVTLGFAGGKGVATALGVLLVLHPSGVAVAVAVFLAVVAFSGYVSLASMLAALTAPAAIGLLGGPGPVVVAAAVMAAIVLVRHHGNLRRLAGGTEPRFALRKRQAPPQK